jgi:glycosyltransferase involved in cell wall biosynthesis
MIHFVYAVPTSPTLAGRIRQRGILAAQRAGLPVSYVGRRDRVSSETWPNRAPTTITAHVYRALRQRAAARLYDVREHQMIPGGPQDVLIGHYLAGDDSGVWQRSCREGRFAARIAMNPLHHHMPEVCGELDPYVPAVDRIFGIMGRYWYDTWRQSALSHWFPKIVPFDMAIDVAAFPRLKIRFNPPGRRRFLYIGWAGAQKGTHLLSILFGLARNHRCVAVGPSRPLANIECRPRVLFTLPYVQRLAAECDFVIAPAVSDANPTVILEAMAWGFPVACTPQAGYYNIPELVPLSITDMRHNVAMLDMLQEAREEELLARADAARRLVTTRYTWERFETTLCKALNEVMIEKGLPPLAAGASQGEVMG